MRLIRAVTVALGLSGLLIGAAAQAATPASGRLLDTNRSLTWTGGPFFLSEPNYVSEDCLGGASDPLCDHFMLTINMPSGTDVEVSVKTEVPNPPDGAQPLDGDDYDLFVYAPNGALVASAANVKGDETVVFRHSSRYSGRPYEVRVHPWFVLPGSTYEGSARVL